jgi:hypothetical protein
MFKIKGGHLVMIDNSVFVFWSYFKIDHLEIKTETSLFISLSNKFRFKFGHERTTMSMLPTQSLGII